MSDLSDLIARVEAATGPDRELEWAIWAHVQGVSVNATGEYRGVLRWPLYEPSPVTASLDSALALVERCLPELLGWKLESTGTPWARLYLPANAAYSAAAHTPALALLLALLRALQAQASESNRKDGSSPQISLNPTSEAKTR